MGKEELKAGVREDMSIIETHLADKRRHPYEYDQATERTADRAARELDAMYNSGDLDQRAALKEALWEVAGRNHFRAFRIIAYMAYTMDLPTFDTIAFFGIEKLVGENGMIYGKLACADGFSGMVTISRGGANVDPVFVIEISAYKPKHRDAFHEENLLDSSTDFASQIDARLATLKVEYPEYFPE